MPCRTLADKNAPGSPERCHVRNVVIIDVRVNVNAIKTHRALSSFLCDVQAVAFDDVNVNDAAGASLPSADCREGSFNRAVIDLNFCL